MGKLGITWLFTLFGLLSLLGVFFSAIYIKDTTYTDAPLKEAILTNNINSTTIQNLETNETIDIA
jgi:hypothetical protein